MLSKIFVVTDLGPGDGGKGGIVHALSCKYDASVIIKRGGAQGSHGVRTSEGEKFNFSQWGCGTLEGVPTFLSEQMVISPLGLKNESEALKKLGIYDPFELLTVDPSCIASTPFHTISSQFEELSRGKNPRGTIGTGVGQAYRMQNTLGKEYTVFASELTNRELVRTKLQRQLEYYRKKYIDISFDNGIQSDRKLFAENYKRLFDDGFLQYCLDIFEDVSKKLKFKSLSEVIHGEGTAVAECSHGVLTDAGKGFKPHVSAIRTLPEFTNNMLQAAGYSGEIINYAVHRAYEIRHGAGPMPTYDPIFTAHMLPDSHKAENRWQGIIRAGALDFNLMRYALASTDIKFDGICLTWFDQILADDRCWQYCTHYENAPEAGEPYAEFLEGKAIPVNDVYRVKKPISKQELFEVVNQTLQEQLGVPLSIISLGPTEKDKVFSTTK